MTMAAVTVIPAASGGGGASTDNTYITQTAASDLTAEQAMGSLASGLVYNTTTTGVQSIATATQVLSSLSGFSTEYAVAAFLAGKVTIPNAFYLYDDFSKGVAQSGSTVMGWSIAGSLGGTCTRSGLHAVSLTTTAGAGNAVDIVWGAQDSSAVNPLMMPGTSAATFGIRYRVKLANAISGADQYAALHFPGGATIGYYGGASTTKFTCQGWDVGSTLTSTVSIDTAWHVIDVWRDGVSTLSFSVDGETPLTANDYQSANTTLKFITRSGTSSVAVNQTIDYIGLLLPRQ